MEVVKVEVQLPKIEIYSSDETVRTVHLGINKVKTVRGNNNPEMRRASSYVCSY